jgi:hypothetical protein
LKRRSGSSKVTLNDEQMHRLDAATAIALGYPHDLNRLPEQRGVMTGGRFEQIDFPTRGVR